MNMLSPRTISDTLKNRNITRIDEIESQLNELFSVERQISIGDQIEVNNLQIEIDKIIKIVRLTSLNEVRLYCFQDRIDDIYAQYEPSTTAFINADKLMKEKELLN